MLDIIMIFNSSLTWFDIRSMLKRMGLSIYAQNAVLPMAVELHLGRRNWKLLLMGIVDYRNQLWRQFELDRNHLHGEKTNYLHQGNPSLHSFMSTEKFERGEKGTPELFLTNTMHFFFRRFSMFYKVITASLFCKFLIMLVERLFLKSLM